MTSRLIRVLLVVVAVGLVVAAGYFLNATYAKSLRRPRGEQQRGHSNQRSAERRARRTRCHARLVTAARADDCRRRRGRPHADHAAAGPRRPTRKNRV